MDTIEHRLSQFYLKVLQPLAKSKCWKWLGRFDKDGYAMWDIFINGKRETRAARIVCILFKGGICPDLQPDHLCKNRGCVNPSHLEIVTPRENTLRSNGIAGKNARKTHCVNGHTLSEKNIYRRNDRNGGRECRLCRRERVRHH